MDTSQYALYSFLWLNRHVRTAPRAFSHERGPYNAYFRVCYKLLSVSVTRNVTRTNDTPTGLSIAASGSHIFQVVEDLPRAYRTYEMLRLSNFECVEILIKCSHLATLNVEKYFKQPLKQRNNNTMTPMMQVLEQPLFGACGIKMSRLGRCVAQVDRYNRCQNRHK